MEWSPPLLEAFHSILDLIAQSSKLVVPANSDVFCLHTDASGLGVGATLNVIRRGEELPVAFYSRQLQGAQKRYAATELECLAVYQSVLHFAHFLLGHKFVIHTDHKALVHLLSSRALNRRLMGWVLKLQDFDFTIEYKPWPEMGDADALSCQSWSSHDREEQTVSRVEQVSEVELQEWQCLRPENEEDGCHKADEERSSREELLSTAWSFPQGEMWGQPHLQMLELFN